MRSKRRQAGSARTDSPLEIMTRSVLFTSTASTSTATGARRARERFAPEGQASCARREHYVPAAFRFEPTAVQHQPGPAVSLAERQSRQGPRSLQTRHPRGRDGCLLLTGDVGTGKTSLIQGMARLDGVAAIFLTVDDPDLSALDFCNALAVRIKMGRRFGSCARFRCGARVAFSCRRFRSCRNVLVIVDEAQRLKPEVFEKTAEPV